MQLGLRPRPRLKARPSLVELLVRAGGQSGDLPAGDHQSEADPPPAAGAATAATAATASSPPLFSLSAGTAPASDRQLAVLEQAANLPLPPSPSPESPPLPASAPSPSTPAPNGIPTIVVNLAPAPAAPEPAPIPAPASPNPAPAAITSSPSMAPVSSLLPARGAPPPNSCPWLGSDKTDTANAVADGRRQRWSPRYACLSNFHSWLRC